MEQFTKEQLDEAIKAWRLSKGLPEVMPDQTQLTNEIIEKEKKRVEQEKILSEYRYRTGIY